MISLFYNNIVRDKGIIASIWKYLPKANTSGKFK